MLKNKKLAMSCVSLGFIFLSGCGAVSTEIEHHDLNVQTKMSNTIFLPPLVDANQKTVFVQVKNTSDQQGLTIEQQLDSDLQTKGFSIVTNPKDAYSMIQVNILQAGQTTQDNINSAMVDGFGGAVGGALAGGAVSDGSLGGAALGGIVGGVGAAVADALIKDVTYSVTTDVQISIKSSAAVQQQTSSDLQQGTSSHVVQNSNQTTGWQSYQTRVVSYADQVNLKFAEAEPKLSAQLAASLANILG